ncbi:DUF6265 family protein [Flavobacterium maritimum]|uniref:DUF6265 family protein n=1 Tax=Flavobacterium maritimum TaxID=3149042 RepID=UPI0032B36B2A
MFQKITLLLLLSAIVSCKNDSNKNEKINAAQWLIGTWENKSADGNLEEIWQKVNDSTFQGQSYYIKAEDTLHFETITLQQIGDELTYSAAVKGQNNDKSVPFKLSGEAGKKLVFENPKHDYPQKISYSQITADSLVAKISGVQQGKPSSEQFSMKKVK